MRTAREIIAECSPYASRDIADLGADALDGRASWDDFHRVLPARRGRLSGCDNAVASAVASILHGGGRSVTEDAAGAVLRYANNAADDALREIAERKPNRPQGATMRTTRKPNPRAPSKTERIHVIQGNYGGQYGWEDQSTYPDTAEGRKSARADLKEYRASGHGSHRLISRRVMRGTQEPYRRGAKKNARVHQLGRHVTPRRRAAAPPRSPAPPGSARFKYGVPEDVAARALGRSLPVRAIVSWPGDVGPWGGSSSAAVAGWVRDRFAVPRGFRVVTAGPWRSGHEGVMAVLLAPSAATAIDGGDAVETRAVLDMKPNGALSRSARACSARGSKLRLTGDPKAASRLSGLCRHGGRKRNGADEGFEYVELDGNMGPRTIEHLNVLLAERLPESYRIEAHGGSEEDRILSRRKILPVGTGSYGRSVWRIPKKRMMTLLPSLLRSRSDMEQSLGSSILSTLDMGVL